MLIILNLSLLAEILPMFRGGEFCLFEVNIFYLFEEEYFLCFNMKILSLFHGKDFVSVPLRRLEFPYYSLRRFLWFPSRLKVFFIMHYHFMELAKFLNLLEIKFL